MDIFAREFGSQDPSWKISMEFNALRPRKFWPRKHAVLVWASASVDMLGQLAWNATHANKLL